MTSNPEAKVRLDLNNPVFQDNLLNLKTMGVGYGGGDLAQGEPHTAKLTR